MSTALEKRFLNMRSHLLTAVSHGCGKGEQGGRLLGAAGQHVICNNSPPGKCRNEVRSCKGFVDRKGCNKVSPQEGRSRIAAKPVSEGQASSTSGAKKNRGPQSTLKRRGNFVASTRLHSETVAEHRSRHRESQPGCARCWFDRLGHQWQQSFGAKYLFNSSSLILASCLLWPGCFRPWY